MDQSAQHVPQQWSPDPEPVGAQQPHDAAPEHQMPHYGPPANYAQPPAQQFPYPQQPAQGYPTAPMPPQQYPPQQPYGQQPYPQQQPYIPPQQYPQAPVQQQPPMPPQAPYQQYPQYSQYPQYPQQGYPAAPVPPQQTYPQQQYAPAPAQQYPQPPMPPQQYPQAPAPQQQPMQQQPPQGSQQSYVPPFGLGASAAQIPMAPPVAPQQPVAPQPVVPQIPQQFSPSASQSSSQLPSPDQSGGAPVSFPPPPNPPKVRDAFLKGAGPYLQPGEQVFYGFILKLEAAIEETPEDLRIAIDGQHHLLGDMHRASTKMNRGMKWASSPMDAFTEKLTDKANEALTRHLAGPVFVGGWTSQAGWFIRYVRATAEDYGPGAYGAVTNQRYLVFRGARVGGSAMRLVYAVPRTVIVGVRLENGVEAIKHGRTSPRAELYFSDGSMVATMMPSKQGEQLAAVLRPPTY